MIKKQLIYPAQVLLLTVFLLAGCAHRSVTPDRGASTDPSTHQKRQATVVKAAGMSSDSVMENDPGSDPFGGGLDMFDDEFEDEKVQVLDPLSPWNRLMFHFNDKFYFWLLKPLAKGYQALMPHPIRVGVRNFFHNLAAPVRIVNCALQGKGNSAVEELGKFLINSTVGIAGFRNVGEQYAKHDPGEEDLGQTLGAYGIGNGIYIVWPLLGPSTLRDTVGLVGDSFLNPVSYIDPWETAAGISSYKVLNETSFQIGDYETLKESAIEPYEALKDVYLQNRRKKVED